MADAIDQGLSLWEKRRVLKNCFEFESKQSECVALRKHFENSPENWIGKRISIYWADDEMWYSGFVNQVLFDECACNVVC